MPRFVVTKQVDAFVHYDALIEAATAQEAAEIAERDEENHEWVLNGVVNTFQHREFPVDLVEEHEDETDSLPELTPIFFDEREIELLVRAISLAVGGLASAEDKTMMLMLREKVSNTHPDFY